LKCLMSAAAKSRCVPCTLATTCKCIRTGHSNSGEQFVLEKNGDGRVAFQSANLTTISAIKTASGRVWCAAISTSSASIDSSLRAWCS
jgi:hypothetical protein